MKKIVNHFTDDFKLMVVQEYLNTDHSQAELKKKYGFSGNNCISNWMRKFGMKTPDEQKIQLHQVMKKESEKTKQELELEAKVRELEKTLEYERLKTLALNTMIDIAERDLKISIRKKHGTKQ